MSKPDPAPYFAMFLCDAKGERAICERLKEKAAAEGWDGLFDWTKWEARLDGIVPK